MLTNTHTHTHTHSHSHAHTYRQKHTYTHRNTHRDTHAHTKTHTCTHTCTHKHTHATKTHNKNTPPTSGMYLYMCKTGLFVFHTLVKSEDSLVAYGTKVSINYINIMCLLVCIISRQFKT